MRLPISLAASLLALALLAGHASALTIGDPAPALAVGSWAKGEPVKSLDKGNLYVVEFWATWCGPCKASIPHLTELAHKHKDVTFVGVSVWENDDAAVAPFIKEMGDKMDYHVALDDKSKDPKGIMAKTWMEAAQQNGIPTAFIVGKDSTILWIGHPMAIEEPLAQVLAGTYDIKAAKAALEKEQKEVELQQKLRSEINTAMEPALKDKDYDAAFKNLDALTVKHPDAADLIDSARTYLAIRGKQWDTFYAVADKVAAGAASADRLNALAWTIATDPRIEKRDLDRALKYATRGVELSKGDPQILDTLARVYWEKGDKAKALEFQEKAVAKASGEAKTELEKTLTKYKEK